MSDYIPRDEVARMLGIAARLRKVLAPGRVAVRRASA